MTKTILHVVTNVDAYRGQEGHPTGLWLTELTHAWQVFEQAGFRQLLVSPKGGAVPLEPRSLEAPMLDAHAKQWIKDPAKQELLQKTLSPDRVDPSQIDAIYFTGGHAVMYDFLDNPELHSITSQLFEAGKIVSSVCHGFCGLLNVKLSDGSYLISGRQLTGFSWQEEILAEVAELVPYNAEELAVKHGAQYTKSEVPFQAYAVQDKNLITGQNPASAQKTAELVVQALA